MFLSFPIQAGTAPAAAGWVSYANTGTGPKPFLLPTARSLPGLSSSKASCFRERLTAGRYASGPTIPRLSQLMACTSGLPPTSRRTALAPQVPWLPDRRIRGYQPQRIKPGNPFADLLRVPGGRRPFWIALHAGSVDSTSRAQVAGTPEPATVVMLGGGLLGLSALIRRRKAS